MSKQVERIVEAGLTERALARLIISVRRATGEPRDVTPLVPEAQRGARAPARPVRGNDRGDDRPQRFEQRESGFDDRGERPERGPRQFERRPSFSDRPPEPRGGGDQWVPFRVSWGEAHGADARRLVAMLCRRGNIRGSDIGAIRVSRTSSIRRSGPAPSPAASKMRPASPIRAIRA